MHSRPGLHLSIVKTIIIYILIARKDCLIPVMFDIAILQGEKIR